MTKHIPNLLTLINLLCGCAILVLGLDFLIPFLAVALAADFLDGFVARKLNVQSKIGAQLDSMADMVTFGVLPGFIIYELLQTQTANEWIPLAGFVITAFSALRLAKFNVSEEDNNYFSGLATPANTILIVGIWFLFQSGYDSAFCLPCLFAVIVISSYLLISKLKLFTLKFKHFGWKGNEVRYLLIILSLLLLILFKFAALSLIILLYIILSIAFKKNTHEI